MSAFARKFVYSKHEDEFFVIIQAFLSTAPHCFAQGFEHLQDKGCFTVVQSKLLMVYFGSGGGGALEKKVG